MNVQLMITPVNADHIPDLRRCPHCGGPHLKFHQAVHKNVADPLFHDVPAHRYRCLSCQRTFRIYPEGVTRGRVSQSVKQLAVLLYLLGFNGHSVSMALQVSGQRLSVSRVYEAVQEALRQLPDASKRLFEDIHSAMSGSDVTGVKVAGTWAPLQINVSQNLGVVVTIRALGYCDALWLTEKLQPVLDVIQVQLSSRHENESGLNSPVSLVTGRSRHDSSTASRSFAEAMEVMFG